MGISERRFELRSLTAADHATLDQTVGSLTSLQAYSAYLRGLYAGRAPIEKGLSDMRWPGVFGDWRPTLIASDMAADLTDLEIASKDDLEASPAPSDISGLLGMLYVLEGSSLGARLVYKQAKALGLSETFGARHLAVQSGLSQGWQGYLSILDKADHYDATRAGAMAKATFHAVYRAMTTHRDICV